VAQASPDAASVLLNVGCPANCTISYIWADYVMAGRLYVFLLEWPRFQFIVTKECS
jgi:hypothetical protein